MNMKVNLHMNEHPLKPYIDAVSADDSEDAAADVAQRRLLHRLDEAANSKSANSAPWRLHRGWKLPAAAAAVLAVLMVPMLMTVPGSNSSLAFAEVQSFFTDFRTMHARLTTSMNGNQVMSMDIVIDEQDRARIDSGDALTLIVDPNRQEMLQLFHGAGLAARVPLTEGDAEGQETGLEWLAEIREYQGQARLIDEVRLIEGDEAYGFRLTQHAIDMTLWATESGRPVLLEMQTGNEAAPITTRIQFDFARAVDPERFSLDVPSGYTVETRLDDG